MAKFHIEVFKKIPKVNIACIASTPSGSEERKQLKNLKFLENILLIKKCCQKILI